MSEYKTDPLVDGCIEALIGLAQEQQTACPMDMVTEMSDLQFRVKALEEALHPFATACAVLEDNPPSPDVLVTARYGLWDKHPPRLGLKQAHLAWQDFTRAKALLKVNRG